MAKTADEIILIVDEIYRLKEERDILARRLVELNKRLKAFEDTGLKWISVSFDHGYGREQLFGDNIGSIDEPAKQAIVSAFKSRIQWQVDRYDEIPKLIDNLKRKLEE